MKRRPDIRVIVNADDLGAGGETDEVAFDLMAKKAICSATVLANGPNAGQALDRAKHFPDRSFGVHLNVCEFAPLSGNPALGALIGTEGTFEKDAVRRVALTPKLIRGITDEFDAQIRRVQRSGIAISHLDSHHHVHTIPALFFSLKAVQQRHRIRCVRITRNLYEERPSALTRTTKMVWNSALRTIVRTTTTEFFSDLKTFVRVADTIRGPADVEVMVHPGHSRYSSETALLHTEWWRDVGAEILFISYHSL